MIKVLIVDDEYNIRKGIMTSIDWEEMGMTIVGEAANGQEGYEKVMSQKPDIVVTDVRMPVMDGLELTKLLKDNFPKVRVVIISGYDEFKYAREALRMGVNEYLLKPIGADELMRIMKNQCEEIIKENDLISKDMRIKAIFNENLSFMQTKFINTVVSGEKNESQYIIEKADELNINISGREYQVIIVDIDDFLIITENQSEDEKKQLKNEIKNIADSILNPSTSSVMYFSEYDFLFSIINVMQSNKFNILNLYKEIKYEVKKRLDITVTIGVSNIISNICDIPKAYEEALFTINNKAFTGKDKIISVNDINKNESIHPTVYPLLEEKEILAYLKTMNSVKLKEELEKLYSNFINSKSKYNEIKKICLRLITISASQLEELGVEFGELNGKHFDPYVEIEKYETIEDLKIWNMNVFEAFIQTMQANKNDRYKGIVKVAMQYANEHYSEDIGVEQIAAITYVSPNYFSRVFKKEAGISFTEWLNSVRLNKAKLLLKDLKYRVYEVAEVVGYNDYKVFTHNFKKYVGCTPKEYRENILLNIPKNIRDL